MYNPDKGYPSATPAYAQPGVGGAYPPPPPYGAGGPQPTVVVAPVTTTVFMGTSFTDTPASCTCPVCRQNIVTRIEYNTGLLVWLIFGILCLLGCWLGCCLIPFCVDSCKDVDHYCPNCNHHLSKYKRL
ncbi:lipopolysaccharide-induced tumor necrosis factor-alpha factor homolog [Bufo bufo]|uniref:lipopolysaccharide-induced tumor necrosis factor-alpha factor homolog n=1 Tax=Bufo bufo TaxID=8384 RepID=UPI001ABE53E0|nr:lipopolysaccharide-induced tumor necrosis factor-alpha factor homolog [Bufo bufo]XP_040296556.1 lipopolysaccharide-induced tumor necrosis factor-alpha factor homolog [Bufo bufo]XP_040296557.1 lipopolysaccharide-induced tumor necrosis factor-alpha factor homolog [Bufo bufo]XP_040296558.1 lipopolysaccharide-induced tumor necrosis factor-alpha factor homolog [Bufo bufo]